MKRIRFITVLTIVLSVLVTINLMTFATFAKTSTKTTSKSKTKYTITFVANGGSGKSVKQIFYKKSYKALRTNKFTKKDYVFAGWALSKDGPVVYKNKAKVHTTGYKKSPFKKSAKKVTLYARWSRGLTAAYTTDGNVKLTWQKVANAHHYKVYRYENSNGVLTNQKVLSSKTTSRSIVDKKALSGSTYQYKVKVYSKKGKLLRTFNSRQFRVFRAFIVAGHGVDSEGEWDPGTQYGGYQEANIVKKITRYFVKYCREKGMFVYTDTDTGNQNTHNLIWGINFLKTHDVSVYIDVHCDWNQAPAGIMPLYKTDLQLELGKALEEEVLKAFEYVDEYGNIQQEIVHREYSYRDDLATLNQEYEPCCSLLETGNIDKDINVLTQYEKYGTALGKGLCNYFEF